MWKLFFFAKKGRKKEWYCARIIFFILIEVCRIEIKKNSVEKKKIFAKKLWMLLWVFEYPWTLNGCKYRNFCMERFLRPLGTHLSNLSSHAKTNFRFVFRGPILPRNRTWTNYSANSKNQFPEGIKKMLHTKIVIFASVEGPWVLRYPNDTCHTWTGKKNLITDSWTATPN